jgi:hypothetical protein
MPSSKPKKRYRRYGAFLRLYGPVQARTHAALVLSYTPEEGTPEAFREELVQERKIDAIGRGLTIKPALRLTFSRS